MAIRKATKKVDHNNLKLEVPTDESEYSVNGLLTPTELKEEREAYVPLDFTSISSRAIGRQHSAWSVRHSYLLFLIGNVRAEIGNLKHDLKNSEARWMVSHQGKYKAKWAADNAMRRSKALRKARRRLHKAETTLIRFEALAGSYQALINAASREIARRQDERSSRD